MRWTPEWLAWKNMRSRCRNPDSTGFHCYGGRGISVSTEFDTFEGFYRILGPRPTGHSLDRIDVNGNYEPGNVRWADDATQCRNRRDNRFLTHDGVTLTIVDWSVRIGIPMHTLWYRIAVAKWDVARALTTPVLDASAIGKMGAHGRWGK